MTNLVNVLMNMFFLAGERGIGKDMAPYIIIAVLIFLGPILSLRNHRKREKQLEEQRRKESKQKRKSRFDHKSKEEL